MKKIILILTSIILLLCSFNLAFATEIDDTSYLYNNESGELIESGDFQFEDDSILIEDEDQYNDLFNTDISDQQAQLEESFKAQTEELSIYTPEEKNEKLVITQILSNDIKKEYTTDYYYNYIIKYQLVNVRDEEGTEIPAVVILSYDVADNKNIKPLSAGDVVYGFIEYVTSEDETYNMVNHGLTASEIAYVSVDTQDRGLGVVLLSIFTILLLLLYAGKRGAKLLIPIFVAIDLLFVVLVPEIELGKNILLISTLIGLELIILISVLKNGWSRKTAVAIISSIIVVTLVTFLGLAFANANGFSGKGIISEENYDLLTNVYYIDQVFKTKIDTVNIYLAIIILVTSVITATISSRITDLAEKYAGTKEMVSSIIEEAKPILSDYPMIIAILFMIMYLPYHMVMMYNHSTFTTIINSESLVTFLALLSLSLISGLIISPITAIISNLLMGDVEIKQISDNK